MSLAGTAPVSLVGLRLVRHPNMKGFLARLVLGVALAWSGMASAEPVTVRHAEGLVHGFLALRSPEGATLASGDLIQVGHGDRVTSRLVFHFRDGSVHDETAVFVQRGHFRLLTDHLVQKGPAFAQPMDMTIDTHTSEVAVRYTDDHGKPRSDVERLDLPADLANGLIITLLKNIGETASPVTVSFVAPTPKPRLVKLVITATGKEPFWVTHSAREATHYVIKTDLGGVAGLLAPLVGKQPPDSQVWILNGEAPAFVRSDAPLFVGGPLWRTELASPAWRRSR